MSLDLDIPLPPTRSATWGEGDPHLSGQRGRGVGDHPPSPDLGCMLFLHGKCRVVRVEAPTEGFCSRSFSGAWLWAGPGRRGEGDTPHLPGHMGGGVTPT